MAEPGDGAVQGVVSALTRLRTRTGLREERLRGTELALGSLYELDVVQELINGGEHRDRAVVHAVRKATRTLEPTMSFVADASLSLELYAGQVPDSGLYADDLGQRREALLQNWRRLHELRSVSPGRAPSPRALRMEVETKALTALAVALTLSADTDASGRAPADAKAPRTREPRPREVAVGPASETLLQTLQNVEKALWENLIRDSDGKPMGWRYNLRVKPDGATGDQSAGVTAVSTAYGIRTMLLLLEVRALLLLGDDVAADLMPVAESLKKMAEDDGGYRGRGQQQPRAESTAAVLNALHRIAPAEDFSTHIAQMEKDLGDFEKSRPFILTTMLETSLLLGRGTRLVKILVDSLLAARRPYGDRLLWPEKSEPGLISPEESVAHTARAVRALAVVQAVQPDSRVKEALEHAVGWLIEPRDLRNASEVIERPSATGDYPVHTYHFTAAWVVKALVSAGIPATHRAVTDALTGIWSSFGGEAAALWARENGDLPIWMTFDAIEALRLASLALPVSSAGPSQP
jgi:hypothetical protein